MKNLNNFKIIMQIVFIVVMMLAICVAVVAATKVVFGAPRTTAVPYAPCPASPTIDLRDCQNV